MKFTLIIELPEEPIPEEKKFFDKIITNIRTFQGLAERHLPNIKITTLTEPQ